MAEITAKAVSDLRAKTGVGMMECKKALTEAEGDIEKAIKLLREKGLAVAAKKADRIAADGIVDILLNDAKDTAVIIEVNSETDFVAKNTDFQAFVKGCLEVIMKYKPADVAELLTLAYGDSVMTVDAMLKEKILVIGENITIRRFIIVNGDLATYIHGKGSIGVIVKAESSAGVKGTEGFAEFKKNIALQIAASSPLYLSKESVPASVINDEREIIANTIKNDPANAKKPENIIAKMVDGKIGKYYETNCLLEQSYIKEDDMTVSQYIDSYNKASNAEAKIVAYYRFEKGEGIQKKEENFAEEIAKLAGTK